MIELFLILYLILILLDINAIVDMRGLLFDFLIVGKNRKGAVKIHKQQVLSDRITLSYIKPRVKYYKPQFKFNHFIYLFVLYSIIPQYTISIACNIILSETSMYVIIGFAALKLLICIIARLQVDSNRVSIYRQKK